MNISEIYLENRQFSAILHFYIDLLTAYLSSRLSDIRCRAGRNSGRIVARYSGFAMRILYVCVFIDVLGNWHSYGSLSTNGAGPDQVNYHPSTINLV